MSKKNKKILFLILVICVFSIGLVVNKSEILMPLENQILNYKFQKRNRADKADTNIVFVAIDQKSLSFFDNEHVAWPWPRLIYSKVIDFLNRSQAKAIIFDIDFSSKLNNTEENSDESDVGFIKSISKSNKIFMISILTDNISNQNSNKLKRFEISQYPHTCKAGYRGIILPYQKYLVSNLKLGVANLQTSEDGLVRKTCLNYYFNGLKLPSLPFAAYFSLNGNNIDKQIIEQDGKPLINWYGKGGPGGSYKYYSIVSLILSQIKSEQNLPQVINPNVFKKKIVFIGGTAPSLLDYKATPISKLGDFPAMEIHATVLDNLLHNDFLISIPYAVFLSINLFIVSIIVFSIMFVKNIITSLFISLSSIVLFGVISVSLFYYNLNLPVSTIIFNGFFAIVSSLVVVYLFEGREKRELKQIFSRYVSPTVIDEILKVPNEIDFSGKEITATVFFSDIQDFTSISEKIEPSQLVKYLNQYFEKISNIIIDNNALLDKYIGDGIMAIFGAPLVSENHSINACRASLLIQQTLDKLKNENNSPTFVTRIGLNTGKIIIGNIGTSRKMDYTAIGDAVNLASRLEGLNKVFGTKILAAESTILLCKEEFLFREIDLIAVKGKEKPTKIFELIGFMNSITPELLKFKGYFEEGLSFYRQKKWENAKENFNLAKKIKLSDKACDIYIDRCNTYVKGAINENWNGVFYATSK